MSLDHESSGDEDFELKMSDESSPETDELQNKDKKEVTKDKSQLHDGDEANLDEIESKVYITRNRIKNQLTEGNNKSPEKIKQLETEPVNGNIITRLSLRGADEKKSDVDQITDVKKNYLFSTMSK